MKISYLRVIFDQWPKLHLGFGAEPEIRILKVIYYFCNTSVILSQSETTKVNLFYLDVVLETK